MAKIFDKNNPPEECFVFLPGFGECGNFSEAASVISLWYDRELITAQEFGELWDEVLDCYNRRYHSIVPNMRADRVTGSPCDPRDYKTE